MSKLLSAVAALAVTAFTALGLDYKLAAQEVLVSSVSAEPTSVDEAMLAQAKNRLGGPANLAAKIDAARSKADDLQTEMRTRAALMAAQSTNASVAKLRERFAGNAQVAQQEKKPCDQPPPPPQDGTALCVPGAHEN